MSDLTAAKDNINILTDSIYTFNKKYYALNCFQAISDTKTFFVTRIKKMLKLSFSDSSTFLQKLFSVGSLTKCVE